MSRPPTAAAATNLPGNRFAVVEELLSLSLRSLEKAQRAWLAVRDAIQNQEDVLDAYRQATVFQFIMQQWGEIVEMVSADGDLVALREGSEPAGLPQVREFRRELKEMLADVVTIVEARRRQIKEMEEALAVRREWMQIMGLPEEEIGDLCHPDVDPKPNLAEEREQARGGTTPQGIADLLC